MAIKIDPSVQEKLKSRHGVTFSDVVECFATREKSLLEDTRTANRTNPPTLWFISDTFMGVILKVVFIQDGEDSVVKTAYAPNDEELRIYNKFAK